jgi:hypothetical protein
MKYYNFLFCFLLSAVVAFSSACNDDNEEAGNLACFRESGYIAAEFSYQDDNFEQTMTVLNRGMGTFNTQITPYTQAEMATYNQKNGTSYHVMPEGTYKLSETNLSFADNEKAKDILVTMYPNKLFEVIRKDTESKQYALPLKVGNQSNSGTIYVVNMDYPVLKLSEEEITLRMVNEEEERSISACTYEEQEATEPIPNKGNISLDLTISNNAEEWIEKYNAEHNTEYQLLPSTAYEFSKMTGSEGEEKCTAFIKVKRTLSSGAPLEYGNFILPIQLAGTDEHVALEHDTCIVKVINTNSYDDVKREYDDGKNIIFHVKLAIDKEGLEMMDNDMEFFREQLAIQWEEINKRFNRLDKKGILKRNYIFVPDLKDIIVFDHEVGSNWDVAFNYADRIDPEKFQLAVSYDFYKQEGEGGGGFGGKQPEGVNHIMVTCYSKNKEDILKYAGIEGLSDESIVHELGHYRGLIDTYWCELRASDNLITHKGFQPERGNMMGACYEPLENIEWSEYEMYVINATGCKNVSIHEKIAEYFPDDVEFTITENGEPVEGFTLKFYSKDYQDSQIKDVRKSYTESGSKITLNAKYPLFWPSQNWYENYHWTYHRLLLVEAISKKTGKKGYIFIPVYEVHKQGLIDKFVNPITGRSVFKATIDIK